MKISPYEDAIFPYVFSVNSERDFMYTLVVSSMMGEDSPENLSSALMVN